MNTGRYSKIIRFIHFAGDVILLNLSFYLSYFIRFNDYNLLENKEYSILLLLFNICWVLIIYIYDIYAIYRISHINKVMGNVLNSILFHLLITITLYIFIFHYDPSRLHLGYTYGIFSVLVIIWRLLVIWQLKNYRKRGFNYRNIIIVGKGTSNSEICKFIKADITFGYKIEGLFDDNLKKEDDEESSSSDNFKKFKLFCFEKKIDEIFLILTDINSDMIQHVVKFAENHLIRVKIVPDFSRHIFKKVKLDFYGKIPVLIFRKEPLENYYNRIAKRAFDIVFSSFVILFVFTWLFPIISLLVYISSPGPIFFIQKRTGKGDKEFKCMKFRSMHINKDSDNIQATKDDIRISRFGSFLRKTSMDELPQFFNVLTGKMSVIGPRPHMIKHTEEYSSLIDKYMVRHFIKPGITGWAQVNGYRGETKTARMMKKRVQYDVWYIENWSFLLDLKITFLTMWNAFKGEEYAY